MPQSMARTARASEGNESAARFHEPAALETTGNSLSRSCLIEAIDHSGVPRKVLAEEVDQKESQFSKSLSGAPGGDFNGVLDRIRPAIRLDFSRRLAEAERAEGLEDLAAEALAHAAVRYLATRRITLKPAKARLK